MSPLQGSRNPTPINQWLAPLATTCRPCRDSNRATSKLALQVSMGLYIILPMLPSLPRADKSTSASIA